MKIKNITSQHRRDFSALMKCEFCNEESKLHGGYDDRYYHDNVIPNMKCGKCLKSTSSEGGEITRTATKYSDNQIV
jgi:hypothetical protein